MMFGFKSSPGKVPHMERDRTVYAALRNGASSPSDNADYEEKDDVFSRPMKKSTGQFWRMAVIFLLMTTNIATLYAVFAMKHLTHAVDAADPTYTPKSYSESLHHGS